MNPRDRTQEPDPIDEAGVESFPASDPPAWTPAHAGTPRPKVEPAVTVEFGGDQGGRKRTLRFVDYGRSALAACFRAIKARKPR